MSFIHSCDPSNSTPQLREETNRVREEKTSINGGSNCTNSEICEPL